MKNGKRGAMSLIILVIVCVIPFLPAGCGEEGDVPFGDAMSGEDDGGGGDDGDYRYVLQWGSKGTGDGQFSGYVGLGLAVDSAGNVYVADTNNNRIQKFSSKGVFLLKWSMDFGEYPYGIAFGSSSNEIFVNVSTSIKVFTTSGSFQSQGGSSGHGDGQFFNARGIAVDSSGNIYVADTGNNRIQKFSSTGAFITKWGNEGSGNGEFSSPQGIAVDRSGYVYVSEHGNRRIQKFTSTGTFVTKWGSEGNGDGQFNQPRGVAVDTSGNVYVADGANSRMQKFTSGGDFITKWGSLGSGEGEFNYPYGVAVDKSGYVYVADSNYERIQKFEED